MNVHPPTDRHVPATYYSEVAHEAVRLRERGPVWRSVEDAIETAFGFVRCHPGIEPGSMPTEAETAIVESIFPLVAQAA